MTTKKLTNILALEMVLGMNEVKSNSELVEKLIAMKTQFEKKSGKTSKGGKLTKAQEVNEEIKQVILNVLEGEKTPKSIKELQAENEVLSVNLYSNQKISALLRQLIKDGFVVRTEEKRIAMFSIAQGAPVEVEETAPVEETTPVEVAPAEVEFEEVEETVLTDEEEQALLDIIENK